MIGYSRLDNTKPEESRVNPSTLSVSPLVSMSFTGLIHHRVAPGPEVSGRIDQGPREGWSNQDGV